MSSEADGANQSLTILLRRCKMAKKFSIIAAMIVATTTSFVATAPASARGQYNNGYYENSQRGYYDDRGNYYESGYDDRRGYDDRQGYDDRRDNRRYNGRKCKSGTTGTILGGIVGGLLGREIGRGGRFNRPSTTGTIIGAGAGALAGRALEKSGNRC